MKSSYFFPKCAFLLTCTAILANCISFKPIDSSTPSAVGSDVLVENNVTDVVNYPISFTWKYNKNPIWLVEIRNETNMAVDCGIDSGCSRFLNQVKFISTNSPYAVSFSVTIKNVQLNDDGLQVHIVSTQLEELFSLSVKECDPVYPGGGTTKQIDGYNGICGLGCSITFFCMKGFTALSVESFRTICQEDVSVSPAVSTANLVCQRDVCEVDLSEEEAAIIGTNIVIIPYNTTTTYACINGFSGSGLSITCGTNGIATSTLSCTEGLASTRDALSSGAVAGVVVGVLLGVAATVVIAVVVTKKYPEMAALLKGNPATPGNKVVPLLPDAS